VNQRDARTENVAVKSQRPPVYILGCYSGIGDVCWDAFYLSQNEALPRGSEWNIVVTRVQTCHLHLVGHCGGSVGSHRLCGSMEER